MANDKNLNKVTDDEVQEEARLKELNEKEDRNEEETKELEDLKSEKQTRYQKRIDTLTYRAKSAEETAESEKQRADDLEKRVEEIEKTKTEAPPVIKQEMIAIGDKKYYTDEALIALVKAGKVTETEAYKHQRDRDRAEDRLKILEDIKGEDKKKKMVDARNEDLEKIMKDYPHFSRKHPDFDPENHLYKLANEIFTEGYSAMPDGLSKAIKRAKQILRIPDVNPDISAELNVHGPSAPSTKTDNKEVMMTEDEKEAAKRIYRNITNPATGREYTEQEAIEKAKKAKSTRSRRVM